MNLPAHIVTCSPPSMNLHAHGTTSPKPSPHHCIQTTYISQNPQHYRLAQPKHRQAKPVQTAWWNTPCHQALASRRPIGAGSIAWQITSCPRCYAVQEPLMLVQSPSAHTRAVRRYTSNELLLVSAPETV